MDRFEQELARMMRDSQQDTPFEDRHRRHLRAAVRARQRVRAACVATGSVLALAALGAAVLVLPNVFTEGGPASPRPRPVTSAESVPTPPTARPASGAERAPVPART